MQQGDESLIQKIYLDRTLDETGMSGTGKVAEGVILPNKICVMWWLVKPYTIGIYNNINELAELHSHGRNTTKVVLEKETGGESGINPAP